MAEIQFHNKYCLNCKTTKLVTDFVKCEMSVCVAIIGEQNLLCSLHGDDKYLGTEEVGKAVGGFLHELSHLRRLR